MENDTKTESMVATHEGWFSFCPVWISDPEGECATLAKGGQDWLLDFATWYQCACIRFAQLFDPNYERGFALTIKELKEPKTISWKSKS